MTVAPSPPPAEAIQLHLEKLLASPLFARAERQSSLLRFIVTKALAGETGALREVSIGIEVYGRPADFDPKEDTIVRVEASRLRNRLLEYYSTEGQSDPIRITIPKGGYIPQFEGPSQPVRPPAKSRRLLWAIPAVLLLLVGAFTARIPGKSQRSEEARSLQKKAAPLLSIYTPEAIQESLALLEKAATLDPDSVPIQTNLADAYTALSNVNFPRRAELLPKALAAAERALSLAPDDPAGHRAVVRFHRDLSLNWPLAKAACSNAMAKLAHTEPLLSVCSTVQSLTGEHDIAILWAEQLTQQRPDSAPAHLHLGMALYRAGLFSRARAELEKSTSLVKPGVGFSAYEYRAVIAAIQGQAAEGLALLDRNALFSATSRVDLWAYRGYVAAKANRRDEALKMRALVETAVRERGASPTYLAWIDLGLGDTEAALSHLELAVTRRDDTAPEFIADPAANEIRHLFRFQAAARSLGQPLYAK